MAEGTSGDLRGRVLRLGELAAYQNGAVVSRTIVDKPTGTVTLFAFADGQGLSEHTAPYDAMVQILDGQAEVKIVGIAHHLEAGESIIMPANQPHALRALTGFKMLLTMIRA